ncbi:MAG: cation diffusion facilitator family transporter [Syntrophaceticus schinkii]|nr:cation diffusion facilitator family transporter [Syntrophaceticus schinkii]MDD4260689.1 cation diffusion facilitator family transporter [Syntrophaceticus schinkii]MDD4674368.1 cation diffusion facilitator family transporter [Syntrophaceticus schinkii]
MNKVGVARLSVLSNTVLVIFKLVVGLYINSVSVLSEAIHSGLDLVAAMIALFAVSRSGKPPDAEHQYGHGKIENVSGVIEAILIFVASIWIIREAVIKLITGAQVEAPMWGLIVMGFSAVANWVVSSLLMKTARETDSVALEADALHLRTDVYTSLGVAGGLLLLWVTGIHLFDPLIAIGVALLIIKTAYDLTAKAFFPLLDASLPVEEEEHIKEIILAFGSHFVSFHKMRTRKAGPQRFIDLHLVVPQYQNISASHDVCDVIEREIKEQYPGAQVLIHVEPCRIGDDCLQCRERDHCEISEKNAKEKGIHTS